MSDTVRNLIIIGSGPSGYTAAIYAARANLEPLVFEGSVTAGGALMNTTDVENFPGYPDGIMGPELMDKLRAQAERFGAELISDDVTSVDLTGDIKTVRLDDGSTYRAKSVVLAMGSGYRKLGVEGEDRLSGHGVRIRKPLSVTATMCSHCADKERSLVTTVQPSASCRMSRLPALSMGSMVKTMPASSLSPSPRRP